MQVSIHCNNFDLTDRTKAIELVREMYNLLEEFSNLAKDLDRDMAQTLKQMVDAAKKGLFTPLEELDAN